MKKVLREAGGGRVLGGRGCERRERIMGEYYLIRQLHFILGRSGRRNTRGQSADHYSMHS